MVVKVELKMKYFDADFDYRLDSGINPKTREHRDPDAYSRRLKEDHCSLWSKELPNKKYGRLNLEIVGNVIHGVANDVSFNFNPDSITNCYSKWGKMKDLRDKDEIKRLLDEYDEVDYRISSSIIFPIQDDNNSSSWTINKARGCLRKIADRIDYTLECIRLYYLDKSTNTPLKKCLNRYNKFFDLFGNFENYVKFFCLDDLVTPDYKNVLSFTKSFDFDHSLPTSENYASFIEKTIEFLIKRGNRIKKELEKAV